MDKYVKRSSQEFFGGLLRESTPPHDVIILEGARQVGKTTFLREVLKPFPDVLEINLERDRVLCKDLDLCSDFDEFTLRLTQEGFDPAKEQVMFIDEAQESEQIGRYVRFMKEEWQKTRTILSGSSMTRLFRLGQRFPVGRVRRLELQPFSLYEFISHSKYSQYSQVIDSFHPDSQIGDLTHRKLLDITDHFLCSGGLPEVVNSFYAEKPFKEICREILVGQEDDFIRKTRFEDRYFFLQSLRAIANHLGGPAKYSHIDANTRLVKEMLSVLEEWKLIYEVEQKSFNSSSTLTPKRYLYDLGIAQLLRAQPFPALSLLETLNAGLRTQLGGLFENQVLLSLKAYQLGSANINGWKDGPGDVPEVDFILMGRSIIPIECKASLKITNRNFSSVRRYLEKAGLKFGIIVSAAPYQQFKERGLTLVNLPIYLCRMDIINSFL